MAQEQWREWEDKAWAAHAKLALLYRTLDGGDLDDLPIDADTREGMIRIICEARVVLEKLATLIDVDGLARHTGGQ